MAMPYPEGEVFFKRELLKISGFNPDVVAEFASHVLIEFVYNENSSVGNHRRSYDCKGRNSNVDVKWVDSFTVMFVNEIADGFGEETTYVRSYSIKNSTDTAMYRDRKTGGPAKVAIVPVPVKPGEHFMCIDLVVPIRAVYFPLAQKVGSQFPDLCSYLQVDFRFRKAVMMSFSDSLIRDEEAIDQLEDYSQTGNEEQDPSKYTHPYHRVVQFDYKQGLGIMGWRTVVMDIRAIYNYLMVPRQLREPTMGLYCPEDPNDSIVTMYHYQDFKSATGSTKYENRNLEPFIDYVAVIKDHFGVDVVWQPYEFEPEPKGLILSLISLFFETGLELIPFVGPLASSAFSVFMEAITDPESFEKNNILGLEGDVLGAVLETAAGAAINVATRGKGKKMAKTFKFKYLK